MSRLKLLGVGSCSALWLWSLAIGISTPAVAVEPTGPMLIGAGSVPIADTPEEIREARPVITRPATISAL